MAEGGNKKSPAVKPVPPPKPAGTVLLASKCGLRKSTEPPDRLSNDGPFFSNVTNVINTKTGVSSLGKGTSSVAPQVLKILSKPPLLPKPHLVDLQNKRINQSIKNVSPETSFVLGTVTSVNHKSLKSFRQSEEDTTKDNVVEKRKAPVAKLDEFDHVGDQVSPVRPPRSPKIKNVVNSPFLIELSQKQHSFAHQYSSLKSASLDRNNILPSELKLKSSSLGRNQVKDISRLLEKANSSYSPNENRSPVRPPRRRHRSITQFSEATSPSCKEIDFQFEETEHSVPVYAQVNYSQKKNRRTSETLFSSIETHLPPKTENCTQKFETKHDDRSKGVICDENSKLVTNSLNEIPKALCNRVESEESESETKDEVVDSDYTYFSIISNETDLNHSAKDTVTARKENVIENLKVSSFEQCHSMNTLNNNDLVGPDQNQVCNETCADCLPVQILEESYDESVSSSKLDWRSVRSSFNSSDSDVGWEVGIPQPCAGCSIKIHASKVENVDSFEPKLNKFPEQETTAVNVDISLHRKRCSIHNEFLCKCESDSSNVSGIFTRSDIKGESPVSERKHYKRLTSSLPTRKTYQKQGKDPRRQSWTGYKDIINYNEWKSSWLDEGDSSSGNMGDLDSSDNAVKQSSIEEVDGKAKLDQSVSRRFNLWLSSFGKSGKKSRNQKRHSNFYCGKLASQPSDVSVLDNSDNCVMNLPANKSSDLYSRVSSPCNFSLPPPTPQFPHDMNDKVTSDESMVTDIQSDSDGEGEDGSYNEHLPHDESLLDGKKAFYIANELMTSEQVFINALKLLNEEFRQAIEKAGNHGHPIIPQADFDKILNSLPQLQRLNEDLLCDLEERIQNWSSIKKIADVIVKKGPFLKLYTTYIQNFEAHSNFFDECCQKYPKFARVVKEFEALPICHKLTVKHHMLKPVQRIPQYRLLLDDYARHQHPSSPDYEDTKRALRIVCEVADHANRSIKLGDNLSVLLQLQSQLGNYEIIKPGRVLLKEGELYKLSRKERQPRYFILLNDCLLYTSYYGSGPSSGLKVNSELSLGGMKVTIPQAEDYHNEFSIISSTRSFTLSARSSTERQSWVAALQSAIQEYTLRQLSFQFQKCNVSRTDGSSEPFKLGKEAPIWIQDGRVTKCQLCVAEFTVTFRRHHCRACGKVVCGICSAYRASLQYMKFQSDRVCEDCFNTLLREFDTPSNRIADVIKAELGLRKCDQNTLGSIRSQFKRLGPSSGKKSRKHIPQRLLEVTANDTGSQMCGWLQRRGKRSWKRLWFVLKEQVLYVYKASEDVVALETIPVLGYKVEPMKQIHFQLYEGIDAKLVFQLAHPNQQPLVFSADSENLVSRWIAELQKATVLK